jgi:hypothetical protein
MKSSGFPSFKVVCDANPNHNWRFAGMASRK